MYAEWRTARAACEVVAERAAAKSARDQRAQEAGLMAVLDSPRITTARREHDDSFTLDRYLATGGYEGLRKALTMFPEDVAKQVDDRVTARTRRRGLPRGA